MTRYNRVSKLGGAANGVTYTETMDVDGVTPISRVLSIDFMLFKPPNLSGAAAIGSSLETGNDPYLERMIAQIIIAYQQIQELANDAALVIAHDRNNVGEKWANYLQQFQRNGQQLYGDGRQSTIFLMKELGGSLPDPSQLV